MGKLKKVTGIDVAAPVKFVQSGISSIGNATGISPALTKVFQPIEKAVVQPVGQGLASLDKFVGNTIPGGWGTVGMTAASFIPGAQFLPGGALGGLGLTKTGAMTGLGALTGSGVMRPGRGFNLQGAIIGGAAAYGASKLADYAAAAADPTAVTPTVGPSGAMSNAGGSSLITEPPLGFMDSMSQSAGNFGRSLTSSGSDLVTEPTFFDKLTNSFTSAGSGSDATLKNLSNLTDPGYADVVKSAAVPPPPTIGEKIVNFGKAYTDNVSDVGKGIKNLLTEPGTAKLTTAATGINPIQAAGATMFGVTGMMALDEQEKALKEQLANQQIAQGEYDQAVAEINRQRDIAAKTVQENPFKLEPFEASPGDSLYNRTNANDNLYDRMLNPSGTLYAQGGEVQGYFEDGVNPLLEDNFTQLGLGNLNAGFNEPRPFAMGGQIDDELGGDYSAMDMDQGNLQKGLFGMGYAAGGVPRFLSGGGDGMSDSIPATIEGKQEARLADGEFVIPADVVSHLGNGSSKAGAKQLYSMMDRIRKVRTGNPKQGKQINPRKYLPA